MDTKDAILKSAYQLFMKNGYKNTTTRQIAQHANVNLGLIPYYFGKKEILGSEIYKVMMKKISSKIEYGYIDLNNSLEKFYYKYLIVQYYLLHDRRIWRYYSEYLIHSDLSLHPHSQTTESFDEILDEFNITMTQDQRMDLHTILFGAERVMVAKKISNELHMSFYELNAALIIIAGAFFGIDPKITEAAIQSVNDKIHKVPLDWSKLDNVPKI